MLDRKSLPVWMLADFAIVVATTEMVAGVCIVASIGSHLIGQREKTIRIRYDKLAVEKSELEEALIVARESSKKEGNYRKELLSIKGDFARVIFLVDSSGSMGQDH